MIEPELELEELALMYAYQAGPMSEFAQTREPDNLFEDDFTPIAEPASVPAAPPPEASHEAVTSVPTPVRQNHPHASRSGAERGFQSHRGGRGRGRNNGPPGEHAHAAGRGGHYAERSSGQSRQHREKSGGPTTTDNHDNNNTAAAITSTSTNTVQTSSENNPSPATNVDEAPSVNNDPNTSTAVNTSTTGEPSGEATAGTSPPAATASKPTPAVRGNRLPTGGVQKPKLTESELSERLAAAKLTAAKREAAHAAAAADEAEFLAREEAAATRRKAEAANRRVLDQERERNRARKLKGQGGREWDEGKRAEDFAAERGRRGARRGMHGGVVAARGQYHGSVPVPESNGAGSQQTPPDVSENVLDEIEVGEDAFSKPIVRGNGVDGSTDTGGGTEAGPTFAPRGRGGRGGPGGNYGRGRGRGRGYRGGAGEGVSGSAGRGGRGGGGGGGSGAATAPNLGTEEFPALQSSSGAPPAAPAKIAQRPQHINTTSTAAAGKQQLAIASPDAGDVRKSWADQMEG